MKNLSKYFSLRELTFSKIAEDHGIDNTPTPDMLETLKYTALQLDKVRELLNKPATESRAKREKVVTGASVRFKKRYAPSKPSINAFFIHFIQQSNALPGVRFLC